MSAKIAFINNTALGDALIDLLFIEYLVQSNIEVTLYSNIMMKIAAFLPYISVKPIDQLIESPDYDLFLISWNRPMMLKLLRDARFKHKVIVVNEPSQREYLLSQNIVVNKPTILTDHPVLQSLVDHWDQLEYSPKQRLNQLDGIDKLARDVLGVMNPRRQIHYVIPDDWVYRKNKKQIVICHSSAVIKRQWNPKKFSVLASRLKKNGFDPVFLLAPGEVCPDVIAQHRHETLLLGDALRLIYESRCFVGNNSGLVHLASSLRIPAVNIFSKKAKSHKLWEPAFYQCQNLEPAFSLWPAANCRRNLVSVRTVFKRVCAM